MAAPPVQEKVEEHNYSKNINEIGTLSAGKAAGHQRKTPQIPPTQKKVHVNFSLSNITSGMLCTFQCNSENDLYKHIKEEHNKVVFPCADRNCAVEGNSLDIIAKHVTEVHKREDKVIGENINCIICEIKFQSKGVLMEHIKTHKSYKPLKMKICC